MVINRSILNDALVALTGPLPVHKSKSVLRAEQHAAFLAKRKAEREQFEKQSTLAGVLHGRMTMRNDGTSTVEYDEPIPFAHGHEDSHMWESEDNKPKSQRTYYLYFNGRVSQRLMHAEDLHATCRAHDTAEALDKFTQSYRAHGCQPIYAPFVKER